MNWSRIIIIAIISALIGWGIIQWHSVRVWATQAQSMIRTGVVSKWNSETALTPASNDPTKVQFNNSSATPVVSVNNYQDNDTNLMSSRPSPTPIPTATVKPLLTPLPTPTIETPDGTPAPLRSTFQELADQPTPIGVARAKVSTGSGPVAVATPTITPTALPELLEGMPRGFAILALMHPRARAMVEREVDTMLSARIRNLYLSVLVDGTFTTDFGYLDEVVRRLNTDGRSLTLGIYLISGPTMRRWDVTPIETLFSRINPIRFRSMVINDQLTQQAIHGLCDLTRPTLQLNLSLNPSNQNLIIPALEDNFDRSSYFIMRQLISSLLSDRTIAIRNPCPGCVNGSDADGQGDPREFHELVYFDELGPGDGFTLDGVGYRFAEEPPTGNAITLDGVRTLMDEARTKNLRYFGLWRAARQGIGNQLIPPEQRTYEVSTDEQRAQEIELLRYGLSSAENTQN